MTVKTMVILFTTLGALSIFMISFIYAQIAFFQWNTQKATLVAFVISSPIAFVLAQWAVMKAKKGESQ